MSKINLINGEIKEIDTHNEREKQLLNDVHNFLANYKVGQIV